jgi:hypothetical protein
LTTIQSWRTVPDQEKSCKWRNLFVLCFLEFRYTVLSRGMWKVCGRSPINQIRRVSLVEIYANPRAPGGQSARSLNQPKSESSWRTVRQVTKNSLTASFCEALFIPPTHPNIKYTGLTCETESQAHSKHSKAPQSETLASPLQIFGLGLGLSKIQARFKFFPRDSPLLGISWHSPSLSTSITLGAWLLDG